MNNETPKLIEQSAHLDEFVPKVVAAEQPEELVQTPARSEGDPLTEQQQKQERVVNALAAMCLETHNW